ncbi:hypothetical protein E4U60_002859 [Claviceps pazoutovae]|uniref:Uncharacterized protein n=1 Tax=Claviceps pazoutovae TaxID=1649127 RepID=A0A9P7MB19_9HYPO|nr:hypothetical protein E4U60_002859 [Claviceps pazoutovae]
MYMFQVTGVTDQQTVANFAFGLGNTEKRRDTVICVNIPLPRTASPSARHTGPDGRWQRQYCCRRLEVRVFDILDIINAISVWFSPSVVGLWADVRIIVVHAELLPTIRKDAIKNVLQSPLLSVMTTMGVGMLS